MVWVGAALAQGADNRVWIQVEAQPSLTAAQNRLRAFAQVFPDVNGFSLGGGWYGIALGPYARSEADSLLRSYLANGLIPPDSYIAFTRSFRSQFWPVGTNLLAPSDATAPAPTGTAVAEPETPNVEAPEPQQENEIAVPDETPREARASEARLTRDEKKELQVALKWAGFYTGAIDGAYGRGTRGSMAAFQEENGYEVTGVLTTAQRAELMRQYNAVLDGMDLRRVTDTRAGIELLLPTGVVAFEKYEFPFAQYDARTDLGARVLLISQPGDRDTLSGLYDIMETLEIVPTEGPREKGRSAFTLTGENAKIVSHTEARLQNGEVKGFTLIWPAGDEERRTRVLQEMRASFQVLPGTTLRRDDTQGAEQTLDLVSGLKLRRPILTRSGFWTDASGTVLTSSEAVGQCARITLDGDYPADIAARNDRLGVAVLKPRDALSPPAHVTFRDGAPRLRSEIAAAGFSYGGQLGAPTLTFGRLEDLRGLRGEENLRRLAVDTLPGDTGGPVFDGGGAVLGLLLAEDEGGRRLPDGVRFAASSDALRAVLEEAGADPGFTVTEQSMAPEDLTTLARDVVVLVECWED
ncbi:serine protease [Pseudaestuariivita atlantica]|nr:serine protease [Pseudaestuariivita atlantica]